MTKCGELILKEVGSVCHHYFNRRTELANTRCFCKAEDDVRRNKRAKLIASSRVAFTWTETVNKRDYPLTGNIYKYRKFKTALKQAGIVRTAIFILICSSTDKTERS